jgi:OmpA-OmpF porin, OOP family
MSSLLNSVDALAPEILRSLAARVSEPVETLQQGLQISVAVMLGAVASRLRDAGFVSRVASSIGAFGGVHPASSAGGQIRPAAMEAGTTFLDTLFGSNRPAVESKIALASGLADPSAGAVLSAAAPLLLSAIGSKLLASGAGLAGLESLISSELPALERFIPAGIPNLSHLSGPTSAAPPAAADSNAGKAWLWPILLMGALLIAALLWYFHHGADPALRAPASLADATHGDFLKRKLPGGVELNIPHFGIENQLLDFIEDSSKAAGNETWFDFDRLLFATGSDSLQVSSDEQLQNIAAILKAYATVQIRIGGYTDNTGNLSANLLLSENRADNVMAALARLGVDPARLDAKGYGEDHPVADNGTEEGRAKNRRISLRVTQK